MRFGMKNNGDFVDLILPCQSTSLLSKQNIEAITLRLSQHVSSHAGPTLN
jgi:hypothetical protein